MRGFVNRMLTRAPLGVAALVALAVMASAALAYFTATGTGTATATVGSLDAPTGLSADATGSTIALGWNGVSAPGSGSVGYYVSRDGNVVGGTCGTAASPISTTSCSDTGVSSGSHSYAVTAVWRTWTATSGSVSVTVSANVDHFVVSAPSTAVAGSAFSVTVAAKDSANNTLTGYAGTIHFTSTDSGIGVAVPSDYTFQASDNGSRTFSGVVLTTAGSQTISVNDTTLTSATGTSGSIAVTPATASKLAFTTQPGSATAGSAFAQQPVVKTQDAFGNNSTSGLGASRNVTVAIASGGGTLQGTQTLDIGTGGGNGTATFTNLRIDQAGAKTLSATAAAASPSLTAATSGSFTVSPTTVSALAFTTQPGSATAGSAFAQQPVVKTQDAFGNNSTSGLGASRNVTVAIASGSGTLQGTQTLDIGTGAGNGTATFTNLRIDQAGAKTLSATTAAGSPSLSAATSASFTVSPATASVLFFTTQPGSATAGSAFGQQPVVKTEDAFGNNSASGLGASRNVTVAIASGGGTLQGTQTLDIGTGAGNGTATFTNLRIDQAGSKTLSATAAAGSPTLSAATSNSFLVQSAGVPISVTGSFCGGTYPRNTTQALSVSIPNDQFGNAFTRGSSVAIGLSLTNTSNWGFGTASTGTGTMTLNVDSGPANNTFSVTESGNNKSTTISVTSVPAGFTIGNPCSMTSS